jgi:hypothetical protein
MASGITLVYHVSVCALRSGIRQTRTDGDYLGSPTCIIPTLYYLITAMQSGHFNGEQRLLLTGRYSYLLPMPLANCVLCDSDFLGWQGRFFLHDGEIVHLVACLKTNFV